MFPLKLVIIMGRAAKVTMLTKHFKHSFKSRLFLRGSLRGLMNLRLEKCSAWLYIRKYLITLVSTPCTQQVYVSQSC